MSSRSLAFLAGVAALVLAACAGPGTAPARPPGLAAAQIEALLGAADRSDADRKNDERRKPAEMLAFIGARPGMTALDVSAGGGYTSELLARAAGPGGRVYAQTPRPPSAGLAERLRKPALANAVSVVQPFDDPVPVDRAAGGLDLVTLMFNYHDITYLPVDRARMNAAIFRALRPGGVYVVADHSAQPGTGATVARTLHRIDEALVRSEVEAAGFRLDGEGLFLRNRTDPRDREEPEPPMPKDEFVLRFVKP